MWKSRKPRKSHTTSLRRRGMNLETLENRRLFAVDLFEPNEEPETATNLYTGDHVIPDLSVDNLEDRDWFEWKATADGELNVEIQFEHTNGDLDLRLFNQDQLFLKESNSQTDNESIKYQVSNGETYYIWAFGFQAKNDYTLIVDGPGEIPKDAMEWNDSLVTATNLGARDQTVYDLSIHGEGPIDHSPDIFRWTAVDTGTATVSIDFKHIMGDIELEVLNQAGERIGGSESGSDGESVTFATTRNEPYYFRTWGHNDTTNPNYSLSIDGPDLPPDRLEQDNSPSTATRVTDGKIENLSIHAPGNEDWFEYTATIDGTLDVDLAFSSADGDIELDIYSGQLLLASATSSGDGESLSIPVTGGSQYSVRVYAHPFITNTNYSITFDGPELQIPFSVDVADVAPASRAVAVDEIDVTFDRPVSQFSLSQHVSLVRSNDLTEQLSLNSATLTSLGANRWRIGNLASLTATSGIYDISVGSLVTGIRDQSGNLLQDADSTRWIQGAGDANLDGRFDSSDLVSVFKANQYEDNIAGNSRWSTGDWDGDGEFGTSDLLVAFQAGWYSSAAAARPALPTSTTNRLATGDRSASIAVAPVRQQSVPARLEVELVDAAIADEFRADGFATSDDEDEGPQLFAGTQLSGTFLLV